MIYMPVAPYLNAHSLVRQGMGLLKPSDTLLSSAMDAIVVNDNASSPKSLRTLSSAVQGQRGGYSMSTRSTRTIKLIAPKKTLRPIWAVDFVVGLGTSMLWTKSLQIWLCGQFAQALDDKLFIWSSNTSNHKSHATAPFIQSFVPSSEFRWNLYLSQAGTPSTSQLAPKLEALQAQKKQSVPNWGIRAFPSSQPRSALSSALQSDHLRRLTGCEYCTGLAQGFSTKDLQATSIRLKAAAVCGPGQYIFVKESMSMCPSPSPHI